MKITDLKKGQIVYVLKVMNGSVSSFKVFETPVLRVGRTYVHVSTDLGYEQRFYQEDRSANYLEEDEYRCQTSYLLFLTKQEANDHALLLQTRTELKQLTRSPKIEEYSLNQLRLVDAILSVKVSDEEKDSFNDIPVSSLAKTLAHILPAALRSELSDIMQYQNILEDIDSCCEDNDITYPEEIKRQAAKRYVFDGEHDSNADHWTNLQQLLKECSQG